MAAMPDLDVTLWPLAARPELRCKMIIIFHRQMHAFRFVCVFAFTIVCCSTEMRGNVLNSLDFASGTTTFLGTATTSCDLESDRGARLETSLTLPACYRINFRTRRLLISGQSSPSRTIIRLKCLSIRRRPRPKPTFYISAAAQCRLMWLVLLQTSLIIHFLFIFVLTSFFFASAR